LREESGRQVKCTNGEDEKGDEVHEAGWFDAGDRRSEAGTGGKSDSQQVAKPRDRWRSGGRAGDVDEQERNAGAKQRVEEIDHPEGPLCTCYRIVARMSGATL